MFAREMEAQEVDKLRLSHLGWMGPVESAPEDVEASLARLLEDGLLGPLREKTVRATKPDTVLWKPRPLGGAPTGGQPPFATLGRMPIEVTAWLLGSSAALLSFSGFLWWKSRRLAEERIEDGHVTLVFAQRHGSH